MSSFSESRETDYLNRVTPAFYPEDRKEFATNMRRMASKRCGYIGNGCDCKYGASGFGEQTGCPELAAAAALLECLTKREYDALVRKAQKARSRKSVKKSESR